jgi:hypothetical protein
MDKSNEKSMADIYEEVSENTTGKLYTQSELSELADPEILSLLKTSWGIGISEPLKVIGTVRTKTFTVGSDTRRFGLLEHFRRVTGGEALSYPIRVTSGRGVADQIFLGNDQFLRERSDIEDGLWISAVVELSPRYEREKHNNPFSLTVLPSTVKVLMEFPKDFHVDMTSTPNGLAIEKSIWTFHSEQQRQALAAQFEGTSAEWERRLSLAAEKNEALTSCNHELKRQNDDLRSDLHETRSELSSQRASLDDLINAYNHRKTEMEHNLKTLQGYIEKQAELLLQLDLVDEAEILRLLGKKDEVRVTQGLEFGSELGASNARLIAHIQAYLNAKGIVYSRSVLTNFLGLLKTNDLIILAGDSGSGKTNLVKSFADAIGGKCIVVPVKPNWTSSEDLLGYYNPLEQKYLATPFLEALFEAAEHPEIPYLICLDEMNLSRVEYYFADFLSLLEERDSAPIIPLYSDSEASSLLSETKNFLGLIGSIDKASDSVGFTGFLDILKDEETNHKLHDLCGFGDGESLLTYHAKLRKLLTSYLSTPSKLQLPENVRIIGAINVDETTHYLSPKILDRAHVIRFTSPLLADWQTVYDEIEESDLSVDLCAILPNSELGQRVPYPNFDRGDELVQFLIELVQDYLEPLGIEFGLRTVRQARLYAETMTGLGLETPVILNNIILQKVLPKFMFDGNKLISNERYKRDVLSQLREFIVDHIDISALSSDSDCVSELDRVIRNARSNDWVVNYWSR